MQTNKKTSAVRPRLSILIADDSVDTIVTLAALLRDEGHVVHTCHDATLVVESIARYKPDVCILDIVMPGKTGFSIAREVVAMKLAKRPMLIAMTGVFAKASDKAVVLGAGFDHVFAKSVSPRELLTLLNEIAGREPPKAA